MKRSELLKLIEDEVSALSKEPLREPPIIQKKRPPIKPALENETEIDDMFLYAGDKPKKD